MTVTDLLPIADHLWQSTLFAVVVCLFTLMLRNNRAAVRHRLWAIASIKFLIPLSVLINVPVAISDGDCARVVSCPPAGQSYGRHSAHCRSVVLVSPAGLVDQSAID